ncbi:universal stress protein [Hyphomicrobium sp.]|uniref:universal stress protein n=1 Tax=Hyphomicrobium sp. TaxID=82 RepID=UPI002D770AE0|nr:universal stress protein [Hyphomicrobium sp.]HET6387938.1 universal stress protein [Hyphomicrobium sp.]
MFKHLLIATDGSELAQKAVAQGFDLAKSVNAKVTIVTVSEPWRLAAPAEVAVVFPVEEYERAAAANAGKILAEASAIGAKLQISCDTVHVKEKFPAEGIVETAHARSCDLIVMASHGRRGLMRLVLGSEAHRVVTQSSTSVLICR